MSATSPFLPQGSPQCRVTELSVPASKVVNGIAQIYSWCLERPLVSPGRSTCTTEINRYGSIMSIGDASTYASYYTITSPSGRFFSSDTAPYCVDVSPSDSMTWEASSVESQNKLCFSSSPCPSTTTSNYYPDNYDSCDWFCASWYWWFPWCLIGCVVCCIGTSVARRRRLQLRQQQLRRRMLAANIAAASATTTTTVVASPTPIVCTAAAPTHVPTATATATAAYPVATIATAVPIGQSVAVPVSGYGAAMATAVPVVTDQKPLL